MSEDITHRHHIYIDPAQQRLKVLRQHNHSPKLISISLPALPYYLPTYIHSMVLRHSANSRFIYRGKLYRFSVLTASQVIAAGAVGRNCDPVPPASFARRAGGVPCVPRPRGCGGTAPRCHGAAAGAAVVAHGTALPQSSHTVPCPPEAQKSTRAPTAIKARSVVLKKCRH
jgi:hypothetical protein